jgi:DDE superfamily endonuclease
MGYQKKGYTSGEIGVAWLKDWNEQTKAKAGGRTRLLLVDGHSSHYTLGFLEYARDNDVVVICYPSHSTHVYQGLDVVIFSVLKRAWSDERDRFEAQGSAITKLNFMAVYAKAHIRTFTEDNIRAAFAKTGVVPYNPGVVTAEMMAPSLETSTTRRLPLALATPVREIVDLISHHNARKRKRQERFEREELQPEQGEAASSPPYTPVRRGLASLATTSASFLVSNSPILSSATLPPLFTRNIASPTQHDAMLLDAEPDTEREGKLQEALRTSNGILALQNQVIVGMQAQTVLQSMYLEGVQGQLQAQEDKKIKKRKTGKINMDGRAKILTQDDIVEGVKEWQDCRDKAIEEAASKKKAKNQYSLAMDVWKVREMDRKGHNAELKGKWEEDVREWGIERDSAKTDRRKPRWTKPKMPPMEKALRKPLLADFAVQDSESDEDDEDDGDADPLLSDDSG